MGRTSVFYHLFFPGDASDHTNLRGLKHSRGFKKIQKKEEETEEKMLERLRLVYNAGRFNAYLKVFDASRQAGNFQEAEKYGARAIAVGEKMLGLENKLKVSVKVSVAVPLSQLTEAYNFLKDIEAARQRIYSKIDELDASRQTA